MIDPDDHDDPDDPDDPLDSDAPDEPDLFSFSLFLYQQSLRPEKAR